MSQRSTHPNRGEEAEPRPDAPAAQGVDESSLYRPEALAAHREGGRVKKRSQWLDGGVDSGGPGRLAFYALLAVALVAAAVALFIPVDDRVTGDAILRLEPGAHSPGTVHVLIEANLPAVRRPELAVGQTVRMALPGRTGPELEGRITRIADAVPDADDDAVLVTARADAVPSALPELHDGLRGRASVRVASTSLLAYLVPSMGEASGDAP